ncbi:DEAD/DEAH box helicase family protein [Natronobiforma cellulositropha]|uniref:DEAD/DEAH box helicase family protein n=1 Tax=Natronobiforma cellulositropha TaxID=1679076 RepID=UPI0021D5888B|nr:DEAD/DEAH box helicase family protein [Natronobiforma cellulositropha]
MTADPDGFLSTKRIERGSWRCLERAVGRLFNHSGWSHVALVGGPGDRGADVVASSDEREIVAQVKYKSAVERSASKRIVNDVKRAMEFYGVDEGVCVTNTRLSDTANERLRELRGAGYSIGIMEGNDLLRNYESLSRWPENDYEPYDYQREPIQRLLELYHDGYGEALLSLATGLGKTFVAGSFLSEVLRGRPDARVLVLADQKALVRQFEESMWNHLPKDVSTHLWYGNESPAFDGGIDVGTFQTLASTERFPAEEAQKYDIVVVDEAHHAVAPSYKRVLNRTDPEFLLGLTATPWREDERSLEGLFGPIRDELTIDVIEGLRKGYLTDVDYRLYCDNVDWEAVQNRSSQNYTIRDLNRRLFIQERDDKIMDEFESVWESSDTGRAIFYCPSIDYAKRMADRLREGGFGARPLHSDLDNREIERRLRAFRRGKAEVLTAVDMLNEGVDIPEVDIIVFLRVTHSRRIFLQQLGRGLRLAEGKDQVVAMDLVADIRRIAEAVDIDTKLERGDGIEVIPGNFDLSFQDQNAQSFFREYLADKAAISTRDGEDQIKFPE